MPIDLPVLNPTRALDPRARFACHGCGWCCDQPWATNLTSDEAQRIGDVDWGTHFPDLAGRKVVYPRKTSSGTVYELAKGEGTRCVFLDDNQRCRIHSHLGAEAKPHACRQFPYLPVTHANTQRVGLNFGCKAVQDAAGPALEAQAADVDALVPAAPAPSQASVVTRTLTGPQQIPTAAADALWETLIAEFDPQRPRAVRARFERCFAVLEDAVSASAPTTAEPANDASDASPVAPSDKPSGLPLPVRMLFAANLYPDLCDPRKTGLLSRFTLIPKLMNVTQLKGGFASRLLKRNIALSPVFSAREIPSLAPESDTLLTRCFQARLWQHHALARRGSIVASLHQHVLDFSTIVFYAAALSPETQPGAPLPAEAVRQALTLVEFHFVNQPRLFDHVLQGWFAAALDSLPTAELSLSLVRCR